MIGSKVLHLILLIWCTFSTLLNAAELGRRFDPQGPLGVRLDYSVATSWPAPISNKGQQIRRMFLWSSHLKFNKPVSAISDSQLWQIAHDAYHEMVNDAAQYKANPRKDIPTAMTVLAFGNEIILASSTKGGDSFAYKFPPSTVRKTLELCQIMWNAQGGESEGHKNRGSCGEVMTAQMYYAQYHTPLAERKARVGAVLWNAGKKELVETNPCGTNLEDFWGCNLFVKQEGLTTLDVSLTPEPYDLSTLTGNPVIGQIQLCTGPSTTWADPGS